MIRSAGDEMGFKIRTYEREEDYWRLREFLREVFKANGLREYSWHLARLDYWRWHIMGNCLKIDSLNDCIFFWEDSNDRIVAAVNRDGTGEAHLQVHPSFDCEELEEEMLEVSERNLFSEKDGLRSLWVFTDSQDKRRIDILKRRGYSQGDWPEHQHRRDLSGQIAEVYIPEGFDIRSLGTAEELPSRSWASWRAFHPNEPDEKYEGWEWYLNIQKQPMYRRDLDIVAVAPDGEIAGFCTIWYDDVTRTACYEPVGVMPEYHKRGLGKAMLTEGLHRLKRMGAVRVFVGGYSTAANALYDSAVSPVCDLNEPWLKKF